MVKGCAASKAGNRSRTWFGARSLALRSRDAVGAVVSPFGQWHWPVPESLNVFPASGTNRQS